jgi:secondary thiamine-phosphate synthase enzyme
MAFFYVFDVITHQHEECIEITSAVAEAVKNSGVENGIAVVYVPHTTAGVTINEHADPSVIQDIRKMLGKLIPWNSELYSHLEGNSAAHIKSTLVGSSQIVIVKDGKLVLGTWQGVFFCEFDGPRRRKVFVQVVRE